jgi:hypothetical protein
MIEKNKPYRNKKILQASRNRTCIRCGNDNGTIVRAHYQGIGSERVGKGWSQKPHDFVSADLCSSCHREFDEYVKPNDYDRAFEFLILCFETLARDFREGLIK